MKKRYYISTILTFVLLALTYKFWIIKDYGKHLFQYYQFFIILICGYLTSLKLTTYLADFKTLKHQSRIDIIFLTIFFSMLFIPMSHISNKKISVRENRTLAKWHPFITKGKINYNFGKDYEAWFNDRFNQRKTLTDLNNLIISKINREYHSNNGIIDRKTGFLYNKEELKIINNNNIIEAFNELQKLNEFCKSNNIKLYVLITPPKASIYQPQIINLKNKAFENHIKTINRTTDLKIIYPKDAMIKSTKESNDLLFFKTEHHWTDTGAYIGYEELMNEVTKDYPSIKKLTLNSDYTYTTSNLVNADFSEKFGNGQTCNALNLPKKTCLKHLNVKYKYFEHKDKSNLSKTVIDEDYHKNKIYYYPKGSNYRAIILGTSQSENLTKFIPYNFRNVKRIRTNNVKKIPMEDWFKVMKYHKQEILNYKPDIIIFCITYGNITSLINLFEE